jgi:DNA-binding response OmpR family regulator
MQEPKNPILIVDDEEQALMSMRVALQLAGLTNLRTCADGRDVQVMLSSETFSLVLLDLNMPYVSGHQILRQAKALEDAPPIVLVTASTQVRDFAEGAAAGMVDYLVKPVDSDRLIEAVRAALMRPPRRLGRFAREYLLKDTITSDTGPAEPSAAGAIIAMLHQTRREYRRLIASLPIPFAFLGRDMLRVQHCNDAFLDFLGVDTAAQAERVPFLGLLDSESRERTVRALGERGQLRDEELSGCTPSGRRFVIAGSLRESQEDGGVEAGFVDVTGYKKLQQELCTAVGRANRMDQQLREMMAAFVMEEDPAEPLPTPTEMK